MYLGEVAKEAATVRREPSCGLQRLSQGSAFGVSADQE